MRVVTFQIPHAFFSFALEKTKIFDYSLAASKDKSEISEDSHMGTYLEPEKMYNTIFC
jgi:hypothetical protein